MNSDSSDPRGWRVPVWPGGIGDYVIEKVQGLGLDGVIRGTYGTLVKFLEQGYWTRLTMKQATKDAMEHDPARGIRTYLEGNFETGNAG